MQARFTARALSSLACCVLTFSGCNNYSGRRGGEGEHYFAPRNLPGFETPQSGVLNTRTTADIHVRYRRWRPRSYGTKLQIVLLTETNYFLSTNRGGSFRVIMYQVVLEVQGFRARLMLRKMRGGFQRMITHRRGGAGV